MKGKVSGTTDPKGMRFIERDDKEKDVFIHASAVKAGGLRYLNEGDSLEFELSQETEKGLQQLT